MPSTTKSRIEKTIQDLFDKNRKITQQRVADKCKLHIASVRYWWTPELKKAVREMNHVTRGTDKTVSRITKWRYTTRLTKQTTRKRIKKNRLELNALYVEDCLHTMKRMPDNFSDCVISSPPYQRLRTYNGHDEFNFKAVAKQLYRTMKYGAVLAWIVGDSVENGKGETGTPFRQVLYFQEIGFYIWDTMVFEKNTSAFPAKRNGTRYTNTFEYIFILSKGKPKNVNLICDKENKWAGWKNWSGKTYRKRDGTLVKTKDIQPVPITSPRNNIWRYNVGAGFITKEKDAHNHPAIMPQQLAEDLVISYSTKNQVIYDAFAGSSSVLKAARKLNRQFIGSEINPEYAKLWNGKKVFRQLAFLKSSR